MRGRGELHWVDPSSVVLQHQHTTGFDMQDRRLRETPARLKKKLAPKPSIDMTPTAPIEAPNGQRFGGGRRYDRGVEFGQALPSDLPSEDHRSRKVQPPPMRGLGYEYCLGIAHTRALRFHSFFRRRCCCRCCQARNSLLPPYTITGGGRGGRRRCCWLPASSRVEGLLVD